MKLKYVLWVAIFLIAIAAVAAQQPTKLSLQGKVTDLVGDPIDDANLRVTVSTSDSCTENLIYNHTYSNIIQGGLFSVLLGDDEDLNLTYNVDYYTCTYVNGEVLEATGGSSTTKFRGGHAQVPASNLSQGTFENGNYTFLDNLTFGAGWFIKNDEDFIYRVTRTAIAFKDLLDRTKNENVTGDWDFTGVINVTNEDSMIGDTPVVDIGASPWELIKWHNFTTEFEYKTISGFGGSNMYKVEYIIFVSNRRPDNNGTAGSDNKVVYLSFNNMTSSTPGNDRYSYRVMSNTGISAITSASNITLGTAVITEDPSIAGSLIIYSNGNSTSGAIGGGYISISALNAFAPTSVKNNTNVLLGASALLPSTLSDINIVVLQNDAGELGSRTSFNGTVKIYRHKDFSTY